MTGEDVPAARARGRPRRASADAGIRAAALALLDRDGYRGVTVDAVAAQAGVARQTLYRRWPSKAALLLDALAGTAEAELTPPASGSAREDVRALLRASFASLRTERGRTVAALMAEAQLDPDFAAAFRNRFVARRRAALIGLLEQGRVPDPDLAADLVYGAMWYRLLVRHAPLDDAFADALVRAVFGAGEISSPRPPPGG